MICSVHVHNEPKDLYRRFSVRMRVCVTPLEQTEASVDVCHVRVAGAAASSEDVTQLSSEERAQGE